MTDEYSWRQSQEDRGRQLNAYAARVDAPRETWPCGDCGHKHYAGQQCPDHQWTDFCPYEGLDCPSNLAELRAVEQAELAARYGANPSLGDLLPPAAD